MTSPRWAVTMQVLLLLAVAVMPTSADAQSRPAVAAPADTTASPAKFQAAMAEWKSTIVPAAKKEGEVIW